MQPLVERGLHPPQIAGRIGDAVGAGGGAVSCLEAHAELEHCTLVLNDAPSGSGVYVEWSGTIHLRTTVIALNHDGEAAGYDGTGLIAATCCDLFENEGGDWVGCVKHLAEVNENFSEDPMFCNVDEGDYQLADVSPCAPAQSQICGRIGRYGVGCTLSPAEPTTWGQIKARFRR